jgi:predicted DNA-binding ribbon-helix-helix protein
MKKIYEPHEPLEEVLSAEDAFRDAEQSESRWQTDELDQKRHRLLVELPEPAFSKLEKLAQQRKRTVANLVEEVITSLVDAFALPDEKV